MRLIDADKLIGKYGEWYTEEGFEEGFIGTLKQLLDEQPTVDAIPVQFIQDRIDHLQDLADYEFEANGGYIGQVCFEKDALTNLLEDWEKQK